MLNNTQAVRLGASIVASSINNYMVDFNYCMSCKEADAKYWYAYFEIEEIKDFFKSEWFRELASYQVTGEYILNKLELIEQLETGYKRKVNTNKLARRVKRFIIYGEKVN